MANFYGPMQYRPNPSGITLNTNPMGYVPQPAAPTPVAPQPFTPLSYSDWAKENGMNMGRRLTTDRGSRTMNIGGGAAIRGYNKYLSENGINPIQHRLGGILGGNFGAPQQAAPQAPALQLDASAASFANFLNGRG